MASTRVTGDLAYGTVSVDATAEVIRAANGARTSIVVQNADASDNVFVGKDSSVTTANGVKLTPGQSISFDDYMGAVWGIGSAASVDVRFIEVGVQS